MIDFQLLRPVGQFKPHPKINLVEQIQLTVYLPIVSYYY